MLKRLFMLCAVVPLVCGCAGSREFVRPDVSLQVYDPILLLPLADDPAFQGLGTRIIPGIHDQLERSDIQVLEPEWMAASGAAVNLRSGEGAHLEAALEAGRSLGAPGILTGSIDEVKSSLVEKSGDFTRSGDISYLVSQALVTLKLIDAQSGEIVWSATKRSSAAGQDAEIEAVSKATRILVDQFLSKIE